MQTVWNLIVRCIFCIRLDEVIPDSTLAWQPAKDRGHRMN